MVQPIYFPLPATFAGLGFACCLLAASGLACLLQAKKSALALRLCTLLSLRLPFRCDRGAPFGFLLLVLILQLSQITVNPHFLKLAYVRRVPVGPSALTLTARQMY
jgi:hypothetical protein